MPPIPEVKVRLEIRAFVLSDLKRQPFPLNPTGLCLICYELGQALNFFEYNLMMREVKYIDGGDD